MKSFAILCLVGAALAAPLPATPANNNNNKPATLPNIGTPAPASNNKPATPASNGKPLTSGKPAAGAAGTAPATGCAAAQAQLTQGIQSNLDIQAQELAGIRGLQLQGGTAMFQTTQKSVVAIQQKGIATRAQNQKLAAQIKSPAADGLATVAGAQTKELSQVQGLKGTAADAAMLKTLVQEVMDGTKQNQANLEAAKRQKCGGK